MGPLKQDEEAERRRMERRGRNGNGRTDIEAQKKKAQLRKAVLGLVSRGMAGKARRLATSHGLADMSDPLVKAAVLQKYPARTQAVGWNLHGNYLLSQRDSLQPQAWGVWRFWRSQE